MNRSHPSARRRIAGFSLIELVIVIVLIGIMAGMAVPKLTNTIRVTRADSALGGLSTDLMYARMLAVRNGQRITVWLTPTGYQIVIVQPDGTLRMARSVNTASEYPGLTLASSAPSLTFDSRGLLQDGAVTVSATQGSITKTLQVLPTGRVSRDY